jgi:hypothetical protein
MKKNTFYITYYKDGMPCDLFYTGNCATDRDYFVYMFSYSEIRKFDFNSLMIKQDQCDYTQKQVVNVSQLIKKYPKIEPFVNDILTRDKFNDRLNKILT